VTKTILVVEDEPKMQRVLELQLQGAGYQVAKAESAEAGLAHLAQAHENGTSFALAIRRES
jgi:CheY-like chemotaxis protein